MVGDSRKAVHIDGDFMIKERVFNGMKGLWDMLARKNLNTEFITKHDPRT